MATQPRVPGAASTEVDFELERFERTGPDRIEIAGRWYGLRGRRFVRPVLNLRTGGGSRRRAIALLEHKPWAADDGEMWLAAFTWPKGAADIEGAELEVGPGLAGLPDRALGVGVDDRHGVAGGGHPVAADQARRPAEPVVAPASALSHGRSPAGREGA